MTGALLSAALWGAVSSAAVAGPAQYSQAGSATTAQISAPLFASELNRARAFVDRMMKAGVVVPFPKDPGGGYTHEQHKQNFKVIYQGGQLYKLTGEQKYADYVRDVLLAYAKLYPKLGDHPARKNSQSSGRLFWQVLNDAMWLVDSIQGYEAIRSSLSAADRKNIDDNLFRKAAEFLSTGSAVTFSKIHNHATWATAGVGMTGYVLGDPELVNIALLGLDKSGQTGFLRQSELLFSPDGYYTEGPYYQRFALKPFVVFAGAIEKNDPSRKIFDHRDGILLKALRTTIQLTYAGRFFPFNDAIRDKSLKTDELYHGVAVAYSKTRDPGLLSIAEWQGRTVLTDDGMRVARDLAAGKAKAYPFRSLLLSDGPEGKQGAVAIMRKGDGWTGQALVAKNSSQGMGHGHFDKLSWQYYDNGHEIVSDYGAARFLNIEAKQGGRYLPENESWAKQSIAHNSLVVDEKSHFNGDRKAADKLAPQQLYFSDEMGSQISTAKMTGAYPGVEFTRTLALLDIEGLDRPVAADVMRVDGGNDHQYDLPLHYNGHIMRVGFELESNVADRPVLGEGNGYQHIWVDATGQPSSADKAFVTWITDDRFYTTRWVPQAGSQTILAESGANDPDFNLRREQILVQRVASGGDTVFAGILEGHGRYDGAAERTTASDSQIRTIRHVRHGDADLLLIQTLAGAKSVLAISYDQDRSRTHSVIIGGEKISWKGFAAHVRLGGGVQ
ncbi:Alginate lyase [Parasphingorhabdus marina DSM 22363]|uniref:Alginate lyase n=1 Tax=Parasphingorhabdus marina DSM 22363 TaxID=1123272 RepID=A0A1N6EH90_9SPHN|nr:heparinase II/III family protein [Parasphingorhabdus marina]SIN82376.1 Alginate lyase [Parasphingorhabdus marina DSM 22363]